MEIFRETGDYTGEHSITFRDMYGTEKDTNSDWHLVPTSRPAVAPPEIKEKLLDNPGGDGIIDLTESVTGFPIYGQRKGSWDFYVLNGWRTWSDIYSEILNFMHGKNINVILGDDPDYYYNGRVSVSQWASDKDHSKITLNYNLDPYKLSMSTSDEEAWKWDPFNFEKDVIVPKIMGNIDFNGTKTIEILGSEFGRRPVTPEFKLNSGTCTKISLYNPELWGNTPVVHENLSTTSKNHFMDMIMSAFNPKNKLKIVIQGTGNMSIVYRPGKL